MLDSRRPWPPSPSLLDDFFYRPDEDEGPCVALASDREEERPRRCRRSAPSEFLAFSLEDECYAVPIGEVREIVKVPPLTEIPRAAPQPAGVMNLRGEVLPVYDLKPRLRLAARRGAHRPERRPRAAAQGARVVLIAGRRGGRRRACWSTPSRRW